MQTKFNSIDLSKNINVQKQKTEALVLQLSEKPILVKVDSGVPDWVSPVIQIGVAIFAACASVGVILWQMKKQREHTLEQQKQITKSQIRLEAYRDFQRVYPPFSETSLIELEIQLILIDIQRQLQEFGNGPIQHRESIFRAHLEKHINNAIELTFFIERHAPLLPNFEVFKSAFSYAQYELQKSRIILQNVMLRWLPMEHPEYKINLSAPQFINNPEITSDVVEEFKVATQPVLDALALLKVWAMDLTVELQNHLLGDYADCKVFHRKPIDPKFFVISLYNHDKLMRYFDEETEQGRNHRLMREELMQEYNNKQ